MDRTARSENPATVAGEDLKSLARALVHFKSSTRSDGRMTFDFVLPPPLGDVFARALYRTEAELLAADADLIGTTDDTWQRTPEERRADALVALVVKVGAAMKHKTRAS